ncbi:MAG: hypothetical protein EOS27_14035 [Mesorhizobium sp.]|nr:MAG: hypothetical protein EOS27_14035 [Mesorhizobium sp.]
MTALLSGAVNAHDSTALIIRGRLLSRHSFPHEVVWNPSLIPGAAVARPVKRWRAQLVGHSGETPFLGVATCPTVSKARS